MPRRYLTPEEAYNFRIMGQGDISQREGVNDEDFIDETPSEDSESDDYEDD